MCCVIKCSLNTQKINVCAIYKMIDYHNIYDIDKLTTDIADTILERKIDGREVVFILNCTEYSLKMVSNHEFNLLYESHLHVALTRAKCKIYVGLVKNNDEIHRRLSKTGIVEYKPSIKIKHITIEKLLDIVNKEHVIQLLHLCTF
jgi:hypothetical protein